MAGFELSTEDQAALTGTTHVRNAPSPNGEVSVAGRPPRSTVAAAGSPRRSWSRTARCRRTRLLHRHAAAPARTTASNHRHLSHLGILCGRG